jgi:hypothetical protein
VGIVTRTSSDIDLQGTFPNVQIANTSSDESTTFENVYTHEGRTQHVLGKAASVTESEVPEVWRDAAIVLLGPVCGEVQAGLSRVFAAAGLLGVSAQGWLRRVDTGGLVRGQVWEGEPFWRSCNVLFVSDEDVGTATEQVDRWTKDVPIVAITSNRRGARVYEDGRCRFIDAFPANEVDPTGAGDVFATAFLVELRETNDAASATRFASAAAACAIEAFGVYAIATRDRIEERMRAHPEVVLR